MVIAVIGKIGAGKTTLSHFLHYKLGGNYLNLDKTIPQFYNDQKLVKEIRKINPTLITQNQLDKNKLRNLLFTNNSTNNLLVSIIWKRSSQLLKPIIQSSLVEDPLLIIDGFAVHHLNINVDLYIYVKTKRKWRWTRINKHFHSFLKSHFIQINEAQQKYFRKIPRPFIVIKNYKVKQHRKLKHLLHHLEKLINF